ncbi:hypothetical protein LXL04_004321 [Taraxacum kok-saghyz]
MVEKFSYLYLFLLELFGWVFTPKCSRTACIHPLPTFDDMRFKTPLNKVKAAGPDFLDPSSGWAVDRGEWMSREGIRVFQLIWNITEQLHVPVPVPDAAPSSVAKTWIGPPIRPRKLYLSEWTYQRHAEKKCPTLRVTRIGNFIPPYISRPIGIPTVKPLSSFLTLLPINSLLRCPGAGETKEGLIDQLEHIHNLVSSILNEGIKAGIVELVNSRVISSYIRIKPTISSHESLSIPAPNLNICGPASKPIYTLQLPTFELVRHALNTD